jgi:hypothetical protein
MSTLLVAVVGGIVVVGVAGNTWLLAQESRGRGRSKPWNTWVLRWIAFISTLIILGTFVLARPWYWDLAIATFVVVALVGLSKSLRLLWTDPRTGWRSSIALSATAVVLGSVLLGLAGVAGVLDGAALSSGDPGLAYHGGPVLSRATLYQFFWGQTWSEGGALPALARAVTFGNELSGSSWARSVEGSGFGVGSMTSAGCWIDPSSPAQAGVEASSISSGVFATELRAVFAGGRNLIPCPGSNSALVPPPLPSGALVALWLPPQVSYALGGVAAHGSVSWPGRAMGLAATGLPGSYAYWNLPSCAMTPTCRSLPSYASPTYALSHEVLETITNPYGSGWFANGPLRWTARYVLENGPPSLFGNAPVYPGEVADLCEPGGPSARGQTLVGQLEPGGPPVTAYYRPGSGCVS